MRWTPWATCLSLGFVLACGGGSEVASTSPDAWQPRDFGPMEASIAWLGAGPNGACVLRVAPLEGGEEAVALTLPATKGVKPRVACPDSAPLTLAEPDHAARSGWPGGPDARAPVLLAGDGLMMEVDRRSSQVRGFPPAPQGVDIQALGYDAKGRVIAWTELESERRGDAQGTTAGTTSLCFDGECLAVDRNEAEAAYGLALGRIYAETDGVWLDEGPPTVIYEAEGDLPPRALALPGPAGATRPVPLRDRRALDTGELAVPAEVPAGLAALDPGVAGAFWTVWDGPRRLAVLRMGDEPGEPPIGPLAYDDGSGWRLLPGLVPGAMIGFDLRGHTLLVCTAQLGQAVDLRTGQVAWSQEGACPFFWEVSYG